MNDYVANANLRIIKKNHWIMLTNKVSNEYFDLEKSPVDVEKGGVFRPIVLHGFESRLGNSSEDIEGKQVQFQIEKITHFQINSQYSNKKFAPIRKFEMKNFQVKIFFQF